MVEGRKELCIDNPFQLGTYACTTYIHICTTDPCMYIRTYVSYVCLLYCTIHVPKYQARTLPSCPDRARWNPTCTDGYIYMLMILHACIHVVIIGPYTYIRTYVHTYIELDLYISCNSPQLTSHRPSPSGAKKKKEEERKRKEKKNTILIVSKFQPNAREKKKEGSDRIRFVWVNKCALVLHIFPSLGFMYGIVCMYVFMYVCTL